MSTISIANMIKIRHQKRSPQSQYTVLELSPKLPKDLQFKNNLIRVLAKKYLAVVHDAKTLYNLCAKKETGSVRRFDLGLNDDRDFLYNGYLWG